MLSGSQQFVVGCMIGADECEGHIIGVAITGRNSHCHALIL